MTIVLCCVGVMCIYVYNYYIKILSHRLKNGTPQNRTTGSKVTELSDGRLRSASPQYNSGVQISFLAGGSSGTEEIQL